MEVSPFGHEHVVPLPYRNNRSPEPKRLHFGWVPLCLASSYHAAAADMLTVTSKRNMMALTGYDDSPRTMATARHLDSILLLNSTLDKRGAQVVRGLPEAWPPVRSSGCA